MANFLPRIWTRQPPQPVSIDTNSGLARGVIAAFSGTANRDVANDLPLTANALTATTAGYHGREYGLRANQASLYATAKRKPSTEGSILWVGSFYGAPSGSASLGGITYDAANSPPYVCIELKANPSGIDDVFLTFATGSNFYNVQGGTYAAGRQVIFGRVKTGAQDVWQNGVIVGTGTQAVTTLDSSATARFEVGDSLNARNPDASCALLVVWDRYLSTEEAKEVCANPWRLFRPTKRRAWANVTGGSSSAAGSSTLTFAVSGTTSATKQASGSSSLTFAANAAGTSSTVAVGSSSITFAATGATAANKQAAGSSSLTFGVSAVSTATPTTASADAGGGHSPQRRKRRYILPDDTEVYATDIEIRDILREFVKPKPQKTKKKAARVVPLEARVEFVEEPTKKAERIVVKQQIAVWQPDDALYQQMVARLVVQQRRRKTVEFLLLAA